MILQRYELILDTELLGHTYEIDLLVEYVHHGRVFAYERERVEVRRAWLIIEVDGERVSVNAHPFLSDKQVEAIEEEIFLGIQHERKSA